MLSPVHQHKHTPRKSMEWMLFEFTVVKCVLHEKSLLVDVTSNFVSSSNSFPYYCARVGKMRFERARTHTHHEKSGTVSPHLNIVIIKENPSLPGISHAYFNLRHSTVSAHIACDKRNWKQFNILKRVFHLTLRSILCIFFSSRFHIQPHRTCYWMKHFPFIWISLFSTKPKRE